MSWTKGGFQGGEGASGASEWNVERDGRAVSAITRCVASMV